MPESYIEPMTDRQSCFKCNKTVTGKNKLSKCSRCHAITYCGQECQRADWPRHGWNCVPVMVTEIQGKGRGLVAARDIKMGELIFKDKPSVKLIVRPFGLTGSDVSSLMKQIETLPSEAKLQYYNLEVPKDERINRKLRNLMFCVNGNEREYKAFEIFISSCRDFKGYESLFLNLSLVNHSCAPNAVEGVLKPVNGLGTFEKPLAIELRAMKDISRGDEITTCSVENIKRFGYQSKNRKAGFKNEYGFDCKCDVCSGKVSAQEDTMKSLLELCDSLVPLAQSKSGWHWPQLASIRSKIVDLTLQLHIGKMDDKIGALDWLAKNAQLARDEKLLKKAMATWKQMAEDVKLEKFQVAYKNMEESLDKVSSEFKSKKPPTLKEILFVQSIKWVPLYE